MIYHIKMMKIHCTVLINGRFCFYLCIKIIYQSGIFSFYRHLCLGNYKLFKISFAFYNGCYSIYYAHIFQIGKNLINRYRFCTFHRRIHNHSELRMCGIRIIAPAGVGNNCISCNLNFTVFIIPGLVHCGVKLCNCSIINTFFFKVRHIFFKAYVFSVIFFRRISYIQSVIFSDYFIIAFPIHTKTPVFFYISSNIFI